MIQVFMLGRVQMFFMEAKKGSYLARSSTWTFLWKENHLWQGVRVFPEGPTVETIKVLEKAFFSPKSVDILK